MQPIQFFAARAEDGALLPDATVDVFAHGTQDRAVLFSDSAGTVPLENPFRADANARVFFYSTTDHIDIRISRYGYVAPMLLDISTVDVATAVEQVRGEIDQILDQARDDFENLLQHSGYETVFLAYAGGVVVQRQTQLVQRDGELYRVADQATLPLTLTGTWSIDKLKLFAVGDISLRQVLMSALGAENVSIKAPGVNTVVRSLASKVQREIELGDYVAGGLDDTVQFQNMLSDIGNKTTYRMISIGGLSASYSGTTPRVIVRSGDYAISDSLVLPSYVNLEGEECLIAQNGGVTKDIFSGVAYLWQIQGFNLAGGRNPISFSNNNINSAMVEIKNCDIMLADGFGINTFATGTDALGNAWSHLSTECNLHKVRILTCKQAINNACDHMTVSQSWIQQDKSNMAPSSPAIINKGISASDPNVLTRLHIKDSFLIPNVGTGVGRLSGVRWIDNYGSFNASHTRFGGEGGGMTILHHIGAPNTQFPWNSQEVGFFSCFLFSGPDGVPESCVMAIMGQIPNRFVMRDCTGPVSGPIIANLSSTNIPAYMAAFEAATGRKAYEYFKVLIDNVSHDLNSYTPQRQIIPASLLPYSLRGRSTKIRKTNQSMATGLAVVTNIVSFATIVDDNVGAFSLTTPDRLLMPNGCSKMTISVSVIMAVDGAAKYIAVELVDSGGTYFDGEGEPKGINPDKDRIKCVFKVSGVPGQYWRLRIRHNAAAPLNMDDCQVDISPNDYQG
ncbi:hypothetical protein EI969_18290 [Pseudomonas sp. PB101]|uniref:hypothetical protein n=1 Tax=Pseudomonas sp. PB101 TaxID=2495428 RepID=UPI0013666C0C|nr:hypothetical protein [Pseudomonas sp. PB101]MVW87869.1 hypothetical protein [Pseudomonas sp. PB101]